LAVHKQSAFPRLKLEAAETEAGDVLLCSHGGRKYHNGSFTEVYTGLATLGRGGPVTGSERFQEALRTTGGGSTDIGTIVFNNQPGAVIAIGDARWLLIGEGRPRH
jgi:hypothetical protein